MRCPAEAFGRSEAFGIGTRYRRDATPRDSQQGGAARPRKCSRQRVRFKGVRFFCDVDLGRRVHMDSDLVEEQSKSVE